MSQEECPLYDALVELAQGNPLSFHVPGHKNGQIVPKRGQEYFADILQIDFTELSGLDDLHAPESIIFEAETLAAKLYHVDRTFFLVGGTTAGNIAMILATCERKDPILVARNCHKSIMNGLELSGADPIFLSPEYDDHVNRYTHPSFETVKEAIDTYPEAKALILTYPDYFGHTYDLQSMIRYAHAHHIPVLIDEAHGGHFPFDERFPASAIELGADVVVHSVHKMAPAMTMASMLHIQSDLVSQQKIAYYLQMIQSSSPSYPLMASLDLARHYLAHLTAEERTQILTYAEEVRSLFRTCPYLTVVEECDGVKGDPLKITLDVKAGYLVKEVVALFEQEHLYVELHTERHILLVLGLGCEPNIERVKNVIQSVSKQLKISENHATIEERTLFAQKITQLALSYDDMIHRKEEEISLHKSAGYIAAEPVIPYPPGIPLILKGERIHEEHLSFIEHLIERGVTLQQRHTARMIRVFS